MVCATKQHTGKTSVSLALLHNLRKHCGSVGYIKPVGQQWVEVEAHGRAVRVDKDAAVAHQYFGLTDAIADVSPIVIGQGHTKAFLDDAITELSERSVKARLHSAFDRIAAANEFVIVEGTGHCGVGAVLGWNNARVAAELGIDVVLVANGGIGSTFDELALNVMACRAEGANIAGVIINKCAPGKVEEVSRYLQLASDRFGWNVPVLACVPFGKDLDKPSVQDLVRLFEGGFSKERYDPSKSSSTTSNQSLIEGNKKVGRNLAEYYTAALSYAAGYGYQSGGGGSGVGSDGGGDGSDSASVPAHMRVLPPVLLAGAEHRHRRFSHYELVTTSLERFMTRLHEAAKAAASGGLDDGAGRVCFVTHTSRSDIIQGILGYQLVETRQDPTNSFIGGLLLAGATDRQFPPFIDGYLKRTSMPVLRSNRAMTQTMADIKNFTPKMQADDEQRVKHVIDLYAPYLEGAVAHLLTGRSSIN